MKSHGISPLDFRASALCGRRPAYSRRLRDVGLAHATPRCPPPHHSLHIGVTPLLFILRKKSFILPGEFSLQYRGELPQVPHPRFVIHLDVALDVTRESCLASYNLLTISLLAYTTSFLSTITGTDDHVCAPSRNIRIPVVIPPRQKVHARDLKASS